MAMPPDSQGWKRRHETIKGFGQEFGEIVAPHERFNFTSIDELKNSIQSLRLDIALSTDLTPLGQGVRINNRKTANALAVLPMEGCDSKPDGSPSELVRRRYLRLAGGGAGLLWWEACAVTREGRANPLQMMLTEGNTASFQALLEQCNTESESKNGYRPVHILQLTHSGRYSRPESGPAPMIPQHDPILDPRVGLAGTEPVVSDDYLDDLVGRYVESALHAQKAGFDGVDIKACHRYLVSELLASHTRMGKYGGSFENRKRFLLDVVRAVRQAAGNDFIVACRFNIFDAHPYPYGFGQDKKGGFLDFDPAEPVALARELCACGTDLLSNSAGNPYYIYPQVTRPFDTSSTGIPVPDEHPLESVARLFDFTSRIQKAAGSIPVVGNGYTWLRQFIPYAGAANLLAGRCALVGLGRSSLAYPDAPRDILAGSGMDPKKCCITCSKCTQIMRDHGRTGCVIRDAAVYVPLYNEARKNAETHIGKRD